MPKIMSLLVLIALLLAGAATATAEDVVVTQYKADPSGAAIAVAIEKGFFKQAGIDITGVISGAGGGTSVRSAIASDLGFGEVSPAPVISAIEQGQDIKIIYLGSRSLADNVVIVMPNSPIKSVQNLKGKKFAISNPKSLGEMTAVLVFEQAGLSPMMCNALRSEASPARSRRWRTELSMPPAFRASCSSLAAARANIACCWGQSSCHYCHPPSALPPAI
jgi:ABC-type nitrate/sulfonate/bicarbonate transport system substrate-binding protein